MRISYLTMAMMLASAAIAPAQAAPERTDGSVDLSVAAAVSADVQIAQRGDRGDRGDRGNRGGGRGNDNQGGGSAVQQQAQPQPQFQAPVQQSTPQFDPRGRSGRDRSTLNTSPAQTPQSQGQNGGGFRGDRFGQRPDGNRDNAFGRRFGNRGDQQGQVDRTPRRAEGQVFNQARDGRFGQRPDINRDNRNHDRRFDGNRDNRFDRRDNRRFDDNRNGGSNHRFERHGGGWVDRGSGYGNNNGWNREWRGDRRYNWQGYRNQYRDNYRQPRYYNPYGYGYGYQRFGIGIYLNSLFFSDRYWINDPYEYRLPAAPYGYRWIRYYDDVLLVDQRNGYVVDVIHNFFW